MEYASQNRAKKRQRLMENSSSSSDEEDLNLNEETITRLMELEKQLKKSPNLYDIHIEYLTLLRSNGLKEKLKKARKAFQVKFPLSEKLWLEWIEDEEGSNPEEMEKLFALAVEDYLSIELWKKYLEFVRDHTLDLSQTSKWRTISSQALDLCGVHFSQGYMIWTIVLEFEKQILNLMDQDDVDKDDQIELIRQLYFQAMQIPLQQLDELVQSYGEWESSLGSMTTEPPPHIQSLLPSIQEAITIRNKFEQSVAENSDPVQLLADYVAYCGLEEKHGSLRQVQCIYERAIFAFPVTHSLWLHYGSYIEKKSKDFSVILKLYQRSVRNCPWLGTLWERMIRSCAVFEQGIEQTQSIYDQALQAGLKCEEDYITVILAWLDYLRCQYWKDHKEKGEEGASFEVLRNAFTFASSLMKSYFPKYYDPELRISKYWAQCELNIGRDIEQARVVWEEVIKNEKAAKSYKTWTLYIQLELSEKHNGPVRKLYHRAFNQVKDYESRYQLAQDWLRHEGSTGTPKQYNNTLNHLQTFLEEYTTSSLTKRSPQLASSSKKKTQKMPQLTETEITALRRHKGKEQSSRKGQSKTPDQPRTRFEAKSLEEQSPRVFYDDKNTLFITRIAPGTQDDELREIFTDCGTVTALRHMRYPNGETKGRAYIVFETEDAMNAGLLKNSTSLRGRKLLVQISKPTRIQPGPGQKEQPMQEPLTNEDFRKTLK